MVIFTPGNLKRITNDPQYPMHQVSLNKQNNTSLTWFGEDETEKRIISMQLDTPH